jgi:hypothetical protein
VCACVQFRLEVRALAGGFTVLRCRLACLAGNQLVANAARGLVKAIGTAPASSRADLIAAAKTTAAAAFQSVVTALQLAVGDRLSPAFVLSAGCPTSPQSPVSCCVLCLGPLMIGGSQPSTDTADLQLAAGRCALKMARFSELDALLSPTHWRCVSQVADVSAHALAQCQLCELDRVLKCLSVFNCTRVCLL